MVAFVLVMAFSPLGYLRTPGLTITFLTEPVTLGAINLGPTAGAICGGAFGLTCAILALTGGFCFQRSLITYHPFWTFIYLTGSTYPVMLALRSDLSCASESFR